MTENTLKEKSKTIPTNTAWWPLTSRGRRIVCPDDILISTMLRYDGDAQATIQQAREYEEAGVKLGIVSIPKDKSPEIVEEIAEILA